jgi:hypothetical protein
MKQCLTHFICVMIQGSFFHGELYHVIAILRVGKDIFKIKQSFLKRYVLA